MVRSLTACSRSVRNVGGFLLAGVLSFAAPATAQQNWVNPDVNALRDEVQRLSGVVDALGRGGGTGGAVGAPSADSFVRLDVIENQLRTLTGRIEQMEFQMRRLEERNRSELQAMRFRLEAIEGGVEGATVGGAADLAPTANGLGGSLNPDAAYNATGAQLARSAQASQSPQVPQNAQASSGGSIDGFQRPASTERWTGAVEVDDQGRLVQSGGAATGGLGQVSALEPRPQVGQTLGARPAAAIPAGADALYRDAVERVRAGAFADAEQLLRAFVSQHPSDPRIGDAKYWLGETHYVRGEFADSARIFLDAYRSHPEASKAPDSLLKLGMTLSQLNQRDEACLTFREVAVQFPGAPVAVRDRAEIEASRAGCG